jgi:nitronate monooxygenase
VTLKALLDGLPIPIVQAPMGGATGVDIALAVSRGGGLGSFAGVAFAPEEIEAGASRLEAELGGRPFAINLLINTSPQPEPAAIDAGLKRLARYYEELGAPLPAAPNRFGHDFQAQLSAVTRAAPPIASFAFDCLDRTQIEALKAAGSYVIGTANTVAEARAWVDAGADGICAQGMEAGGHRGNFLADVDDSLVGTLALVAGVRAAVDVPVIAAGGIMDGRGVAAVLALGADAAQMGSAFLLADEAITNGPWRRAIANVGEDATRLTRAFSGRYARGIENRFMREMRPVERDVPAYPIQNRLTQPLRAAAEAADNPEMMSLWAGQAITLARPGRAEEMVRRWWAEAQEAARGVLTRGRQGG